MNSIEIKDPQDGNQTPTNFLADGTYTVDGNGSGNLPPVAFRVEVVYPDLTNFLSDYFQTMDPLAWSHKLMNLMASQSGNASALSAHLYDYTDPNNPVKLATSGSIGIVIKGG